MPWCPRCRNEYPEDAESCLICQSPLVDEQPDIGRVTAHGHGWTVLIIVGVSILATLVGAIVAWGVIFLLGYPLSHAPRRVVSAIGWLVWAVIAALVAYYYGRRTRRELPIGYVFIGWLIWPAWGVLVALLTRQKHVIAGILWWLGTAILFTLATKYGEFNRREASPPEDPR